MTFSGLFFQNKNFSKKQLCHFWVPTKLNPLPQYLQKLISGFQKKCATDGQRNRLSQIHRTLPINRISKIDWTIIIQHPLSGSRKSVVRNSNYFRSVSWEAAVWKCSIEWLFWIFRENSQEHSPGRANFWVKVQAKGWKLATKLKIGLTENFLKRFWIAFFFFFQNTSKRPPSVSSETFVCRFFKNSSSKKKKKKSQENLRCWLQSYVTSRLGLQLY